MTPDIEKIEHLLNAKAFAELNAAERELVLAHLSGSAEYEHMRETLVRVKKVFVAEATALAPDADLKEQILNRFEQNKTRYPSLSERLAAFIQTILPSPGSRFAGALTLMLLVTGIVFWALPKQQAEMAQQLLPPATEPQIVTLSDTTPPAEVYNADEERATLIVTENAPAGAAMETAAFQPAAEAITSGESSEKYMTAGLPEEKGLRTGNEGVAYGENKAIQNDLNKAQSPAEDQAPPVYLNREGYYQYQNSRVADAGNRGDKDYTDAYKNYTPAKKAENGDRDKQRPVTAAQKPQPADNGVLQENSKTTLETRAKESEAKAPGAPSVSPGVMPVWPGVENRVDPYASTLENVKAFFAKETGLAYRTEAANQRKTVRLSLTFDTQGVITKVHVSGDINEARKKAFIQRALQLPGFRFTPGTDKPVLEQTYTMELY